MTVPGSCIDMYAAYFALAALNSATDVVIHLLPIWLLWPLRVKLGQKIAVGLVLMPGGLYVSHYLFFSLCTGLTKTASAP